MNTELNQAIESLRRIDLVATVEPEEGTCGRCGHPADMIFEWAPGHGGSKICDCCIRKVWESTLASVTKALDEQVVRCLTDTLPPKVGK